MCKYLQHCLLRELTVEMWELVGGGAKREGEQLLLNLESGLKTGKEEQVPFNKIQWGICRWPLKVRAV